MKHKFLIIARFAVDGAFALIVILYLATFRFTALLEDRKLDALPRLVIPRQAVLAAHLLVITLQHKLLIITWFAVDLAFALLVILYLATLRCTALLEDLKLDALLRLVIPH